MINCLAFNPLRCVDWRWQRACGIVDGVQPPPGRRRDTHEGAHWIRRAVELKRLLNRCRDDMDQSLVAVRLPHLFFAYHIWTHPTNPMRWYIESYLLASCTDQEISIKTGADPETVSAYENLFFNVREKLPNQGYILNCVIGPALHRGLSDREYDLLWKLYGYIYGPYMLDSLISKTVAPSRCDSPDAVAATLRDDAVGNVLIASAKAGKTIGVNTATQLDLLNIFTKFVEIEQSNDNARRGSEQIMSAISSMLSSVPFTVAGRDPTQGHTLTRNRVASVRGAGFELTSEEMLRLEAGEALPHLDQLQELSFPAQPALVNEIAGRA